MDNRQVRKCNRCEYEVDYHDIFDDSGPSIFFVAMGIAGQDKGIPVTVDNCPKCGTELTLDSTTAIAPPDHQPA